MQASTRKIASGQMPLLDAEAREIHNQKSLATQSCGGRLGCGPAGAKGAAFECVRFFGFEESLELAVR